MTSFSRSFETYLGPFSWALLVLVPTVLYIWCWAVRLLSWERSHLLFGKKTLVDSWNALKFVSLILYQRFLNKMSGVSMSKPFVLLPWTLGNFLLMYSSTDRVTWSSPASLVFSLSFFQNCFHWSSVFRQTSERFFFTLPSFPFHFQIFVSINKRATKCCFSCTIDSFISVLFMFIPFEFLF